MRENIARCYFLALGLHFLAVAPAIPLLPRTSSEPENMSSTDENKVYQNSNGSSEGRIRLIFLKFHRCLRKWQWSDYFWTIEYRIKKVRPETIVSNILYMKAYVLPVEKQFIIKQCHVSLFINTELG